MAESGKTDAEGVISALRRLRRQRAPHSFARIVEWMVLEEPNDRVEEHAG